MSELLRAVSDLGEALARRSAGLGSREERRAQLSGLGRFVRLASPRASGLRCLGGVDGSRVGLGGPFPYVVELFRAVARDTRGGAVRLESVWSPLTPDGEAAFRAAGCEDEQDLPRFREGRLVGLECEAALGLLERGRPELLLLDGGLVAIGRKAPAAWDALRQAAEARGVRLAGVIEDMASRSLAAAVGESRAWDRELLEGVLERGEAFLPARPLKGEGVWTGYVRWARSPRAVAVDFTAPEGMLEVLGEIGRIVPEHGRGMPFWLDLVDREVRLETEPMRQLLRQALGPGLERWFVPNRERRSF